MEKNHVAMYGNIKILRGLCAKCKTYAFIIDKTFQCCSGSVEDQVDKFKRMSNTSGKRKRPAVKTQKEILTQQQYRCLYCNIKFGDYYFKNTHMKISKLAWDHLVPFSYLQDNPYFNWAAF
jgi:hypothetical protein